MSNGEHQIREGKIQLTQHESLGAVRKKCADVMGLDMNEFVMVIKNQRVDPDSDDERYIRDFGMSQCIMCTTNALYDKKSHPKIMLGEN